MLLAARLLPCLRGCLLRRPDRLRQRVVYLREREGWRTIGDRLEGAGRSRAAARKQVHRWRSKGVPIRIANLMLSMQPEAAGPSGKRNLSRDY